MWIWTHRTIRLRVYEFHSYVLGKTDFTNKKLFYHVFRQTYFIRTIHLLPTWCTDYYLFIKYYSPLHVSSIKCSSSWGYSCIHAAYGIVTLYKSSWWPVGTQLEWEVRSESVLTQAVYRQVTRNSQREWQYHMLHVYNYILLKMSTWGSKHVEENIILWINNNQCIKLVINV